MRSLKIFTLDAVCFGHTPLTIEPDYLYEIPPEDLPARSSSMKMACTIPRTSMIACYWA